MEKDSNYGLSTQKASFSLPKAKGDNWRKCSFNICKIKEMSQYLDRLDSTVSHIQKKKEHHKTGVRMGNV